MTSIFVEQYLIPLDKLLDKNISNITLEETISLIIHTIQIMATKDNPDKFVWKKINDEFITYIAKQNAKMWPAMTVIKNYYDKCLDILLISESFINSKNILVLLFRLLFIEKYKQSNNFAYFCLVLDYRLDNDNFSDNKLISDLSLDAIFDLLSKHLNYYFKVYNNKLHLEYQLAKSISCQIG